MLGKTHKQFSVLFGLGGMMLLQSGGVLDVNPVIALPVVLSTSSFGSIYPDLDLAWANVPEKTFTKRVLNFVIRKTGARHRSRQTHSWDIWLLLFAGMLLISHLGVLERFNMGELTAGLLSLQIYGFLLGCMSHLVADMLNLDGVYLVSWLKKSKVRLVPDDVTKQKKAAERVSKRKQIELEEGKRYKSKYVSGGIWESKCSDKVEKINVYVGVVYVVWSMLVIVGVINNGMVDLGEVWEYLRGVVEGVGVWEYLRGVVEGVGVYWENILTKIGSYK